MQEIWENTTEIEINRHVVALALAHTSNPDQVAQYRKFLTCLQANPDLPAGIPKFTVLCNPRQQPGPGSPLRNLWEGFTNLVDYC